jgi:hypothetical protein
MSEIEQQHSEEEHVEVQADTVEHSPEDQVLTDDQVIDNFVGHLVDDEEPKEVEVEEEPEPEEDNLEEPEPTPEAEEPKQPTDGELRQADYTRKMQEIAAMRQQLEPHKVFIDHLSQNPDIAAKVIELVKGGPPQPPQQEVVPDDPIEALKYEAKQEVMRELAPVLDELRNQNKRVEQKSTIAATLNEVQRDPLYEETHGKLDAYVKQDYARIHGVEAAQDLFRRLDTNPELYKQMYSRFREEKKVTAPTKLKAPVVAGNGEVIPPKTPQVKRVKKLKVLKERATASGTNEDVGSYLEEAGFLNHLL